MPLGKVLFVEKVKADEKRERERVREKADDERE
jgi:hypothetical protein